jgi:hypothetical protein
MGQEARCLARIDERVVEVKALLESDELILRGEYRARLPFAVLDGVEAEDGRLLLRQNGTSIVLELGAPAARWAAKILNPPTLLDKLGVKLGQHVAEIGLTDLPLLASLDQAVSVQHVAAHDAASALGAGLGSDLDIIFIEVHAPTDFALIPVAAAAISQQGAVWVIHPKGRADLKDTHVMTAGKAAGLVDNKVARVSATLSALRFVIPKANRKPATPIHR